MPDQMNRRAPSGGLIDRSTLHHFKFDGMELNGYHGDTLASALLANGVRVVGRSFKYHRPRGIFSAGVEEPNALVQLGLNPRTEPNLRATQVELYDGLTASSQNRWPSLKFDVGALNSRLSSLLPAGFYYKTFMWPAAMWMNYEHVIRRAAGLGVSPTEPDPDRYEKQYCHCDVLVVGMGPAGVAAALAASATGARVVVVDEQTAMGGNTLNHCRAEKEESVREWLAQAERTLDEAENVRLLTRTTAFGYYDDNLIGAFERIAPDSTTTQFTPRQRLWWIRASQVVLATGAIERPFVFGGNDLPGVMLASATRTYADRYAVQSGTRAIVFTNNDSAYESAAAMARVGVNVESVIDARGSGPGATALQAIKGHNINVLSGYVVTEAKGSQQVTGARLARLSADGKQVSGDDGDVECDLLCVSAGWSPTVHLHSQSQGKIRYDEEIAAFVPDTPAQATQSIGAAVGRFGTAQAIEDGLQAGTECCHRLGFAITACDMPAVEVEETRRIMPLWVVPRARGSKPKRFVDLQNDVTANDVELAVREGYADVEHLKRYTTLGMGTDQGRTSNVNGLALLGTLTQREIPAVGTTTFRPPFSPVTFGALAGREVGHDFAPLRRTPLHDWHLANGATMVNVGLWQRAQYYQHTNEGMWDAIWRETRAVRNGVGIVDVSTLGKIEIQGKDAQEFLHRVYINRFRNLAVGRIRYGFMLREDGFIMDDGTTTRIDENHFYMTTTTANAGAVMQHLEFYAQTVWPSLNVHLSSVTDQWAGMALAGPKARAVLARACPGQAVDDEHLPFMAYIDARIADLPVRLFRMTFSGELAYEIHAGADHMASVWEAVVDAGAEDAITPYGTEAMSILRIEKGHVVSAELDGRTIPADLGFGKMVKQDDFIGRRSLDREAFASSRKKLVGLVSEDGQAIPRGSQIIEHPDATPPVPMLGHVTSTCYSPNLDKQIALGLLLDGDKRQDNVLYASSPLVDKTVPVKISTPVFIDPEGERARG